MRDPTDRRPAGLLLLLVVLAGCATDAPRSVVWVAGVPFETEAAVVTWKDPGGYDAYAERCWFSPERVLPEKPAAGCDVPRRYGPRSTRGLPDEVARRVEERGFDLDALRARVDQFVIHYDVCLTSRQCFKVLHDLR